MHDSAAKRPGQVTSIDRYLPDNGRDVPYPNDQGMISVDRIRAFLWRQRFVLVGVTAVVIIATLIFTLLMTPIYRAQATVRIDPQAAQIIEGQELVNPYISANEVSRYLNTQGAVLSSERLALDVVDALDLAENEELVGPVAASADSEAEQAARRRRAAQVLAAGLEVDVPFDSTVITVNFKSSDPVFAAQVVNTYVDKFLLSDIERAMEANEYARGFLEEQITDARARLSDAELRANEYARANGIVGQALVGGESQSGEAGTAPTLTGANLVNANGALAQARERRIEAEQRWRAIAEVPVMEVPEVQASTSVQNARLRLAELNGELSDLRQRYQDGYPQVQELRAQISALQAQTNEAAANIKRGIRREFEIALRQEQALQQELDRVSEATLDEQDRRVQFNLMDREVQAVRNQLASLLNRYNQLSAASNLQASNVTRLDSADVPSAPYSPSLMRNLLVGIVVGIGLSIVLALLREVLQDRVRSVTDLERRLNIFALGQTPHIGGSGSEVVDTLDNSFSALSEAYSAIRASIDFAGGGPDRSRVLQLTSSQPSEGKTTTSIALARKFASLGKRTLLIDCDLRRPSIVKSLGLGKLENSLTDVLYQRASLEQAAVRIADEPLYVLGTRKLAPNPVELLSSGLMDEMLRQARARFDVIIVDSSPVMGLADAPLLSRFVDDVIFIVEANRTGFGQVRKALRRLKDVNAQVLGVVLTKYRALQAGEQYSYQYQYYTYEAADQD